MTYGYQEVRWKHTKKKGWHWKGLKLREWDGETYKVNKKAVEVRVEAVWKEKGLALPKTPKGGIRSNHEVLKDCGDPVLEAYARYQKAGSLRATIQAYKNAPVRAHFDSLQLTGRTSCSNPNLQNIRREPGARECFVPRLGCIFAAADYPSLELRTLAQVCVTWLGYSALAEALNKGQDAHLKMAADMLGITYEQAAKRKKEEHEEVKNTRQTAKIPNFGFPGGLGPASLVGYAKSLYGMVLSLSEAKELRQKWFESWPEMEDYFKLAKERLTDEIEITLEDGEKKKVKAGFVEQLFVERFRGRCTYCKMCNSPFQGLGADGAKEAGWQIARACLVDKNDVLYGSRVVNFVHDEFIIEVRDDELAEKRALRLSELMCNGMNKYLPDVPIKHNEIIPVLMRCWMKNAEGLYDKEGAAVVHDIM